MIDKDAIKQGLSLEQVFNILESWGGDPIIKGDTIVSRTICHCGHSHKLYYYHNTKLFRCYTECDSTFDIFELAEKVNNLTNLVEAIQAVCLFFNIKIDVSAQGEEGIKDWGLFKKREQKIKSPFSLQKLPSYENYFLENLPFLPIQSWEEEGISRESCLSHQIRYNPESGGIVIPHFDAGGQLIGVRERTLIKDKEQGGKYRPSFLLNKMWNHPLGFSLYNLNFSKSNIKRTGVAIVFESEKSCLKMASFFGAENDNSVAVCGSNLTLQQFELLKAAGAKEICIAFDRQYHESNFRDEEWKGWTRKLKGLAAKYGGEVLVTFMFDKEKRLGYKDSPIDKGKEVFLELFKERFSIS
jgi:SPBc2 prophage-derived uncharacterized protein yorJ